MNKTELLNKCARSGEERVLLARALDKLELAQNRSVPACTPFLSPGEQASVTDLLNAWGRPRHLFFGGYEGAERAVCAFLPDWQEESDFLADPEGPVAALEAAFPADAEKIDRINALARKAKTPEGLTAEETAERAALRQEYVAAVRANLEAQLDNTLIQEPDGTRHRLPKKP